MRMADGGSSKKVANGLVAASCAAVLAVYTAGYTRTRSAAERFDARAIERRATASVPPPAPSAEVGVLPAAPGKPKEMTSAGPTPAPAKALDVTKAPDAAPAVVAVPSSPVPLVVTPVISPVAIPAPELALPAAEPKVQPKVEVAPAKPGAPPWKDGSYLGWGSSRHGDIQAAVVVADGRIVSATIAQCKTMYSCYVIEKLPPEVAQRQSPEVDSVSGATESGDAFYWAVVDALTKAK
jgi:uncharacterized protein with FMN-binding domain